MPRPLPLRVLAREAPRGLARDGVPRWRSTAAVFTSMTALAATSLVPGHALAEPLASPCALTRTTAHHSEGVDTWNSSYERPTRPLDAVMVFLSFPDSTPTTTPAELTGDYFPATSRFFERASYGRFTVRPHPQRTWIQMPHASTSYAIQRDWNAADRAAYLRDALAVADPRVDFSRYDVVYFIADPDAPGVDSDATKVVNLDTSLRADGKAIRRVVTVFEKHPPDRLVLAHETGHVFDLPDLYHRPSDGKGDWDTYVGDWDLMGSQFGLAPDLFGWHKWRLGWLEPHQVACVLGTGTTRLTLEPLEAGPVNSAVGSAGASARGAAGSGVLATRSAAPSGPGAALQGPRVSARRADASVLGPRASSRGPQPSARGSGRSGTSSGAVGVAAPPGSQTFGVGRGTKLVVVPTGPDSAVALEARGSAGNDGSTCEQGVLVYRVRSETESGSGPIQVLDAHPHTESCWEDSVYPPLADAPVSLGESFKAPGVKVRVQVEDRTASGAWTVKITTG
ncbi:M6 family metalloprotease domain-containing protein [Streptomyces rhizosphaerihabitans]